MDHVLQRIDDFLRSQNLSLRAIDTAIGDVAPWETVIFGGSIAEGLANAYSDIDLLLLGDRPTAPGSALPPIQADAAAIAFEPNMGALRLQIESVPLDHLERLARRMAETVDQLDHPETAQRVHAFNDLDVRTLHRIRTGLCLRHDAVAAAWRRRLRCDALARYLVATLVAQYFNLREDVIGELHEGRVESARWLLQHAASAAAGALLAAHDETNPNVKWRVRLLQRHREAIGPAPIDALLRALSGSGGTTGEPTIDETLASCDRAVDRALTCHPSLVSRREKMLARAVAQGVVLPGARRG